MSGRRDQDVGWVLADLLALGLWRVAVVDGDTGPDDPRSDSQRGDVGLELGALVLAEGLQAETGRAPGVRRRLTSLPGSGASRRGTCRSRSASPARRRVPSAERLDGACLVLVEMPRCRAPPARDATGSRSSMDAGRVGAPSLGRLHLVVADGAAEIGIFLDLVEQSERSRRPAPATSGLLAGARRHTGCVECLESSGWREAIGPGGRFGKATGSRRRALASTSAGRVWLDASSATGDDPPRAPLPESPVRHLRSLRPGLQRDRGPRPGPRDRRAPDASRRATWNRSSRACAAPSWWQGKRGPGGGYVLARDPAEITVLDIIEAVEGPLAESIGAGPPPHDRRDTRRARTSSGTNSPADSARRARRRHRSKRCAAARPPAPSTAPEPTDRIWHI